MNFRSDNTAPAHPAVLEAMVRANAGHVPSYGHDEIMARVTARLRDLFEAPEAAVYLVATGTAANALAYATYCPPWGVLFCHTEAHAETDECGAPEFFTGGAKLRRVPGDHGRMTPETLAGAIDAFPAGSVHSVQPGMVTLTNATEAGTVYDPDAVAALAAVARARGLPVHMDGARFANALVATGATPAAMTWKAGVDALTFGGTKNGLIGVEAVILFDPARAWEFELRRKRGAHLWSKHRFLSAQMEAYLEDDLWLSLARDANAAAARLSEGLAGLPDTTLTHPTEANSVFAAWPRGRHRAAMEAGARYALWAPHPQSLDGPDETPLSARLVCSWCTEAGEIDALLTQLRG